MANMFRCTLASGGGALVLTVICDADFAGLTITATDGTTTLTQPCPSSSPYEVEFRLPNAGQWTISGVISGETESITVDIPDNVALHHIPNGSTITPTDDVQIWLHCANIWDKAHTTISQVLADSTTLSALIADSNAVNYMVRSTTWATDVCADSTAMSLIGLDDYCAEKLLGDSTWNAAISDSIYFESVLNTKVPTMTSNTTPSGVASASSFFASGYPAYHSMDNNFSTTWASANGTPTSGWIQYMFDPEIEIQKFAIEIQTLSNSYRQGMRTYIGTLQGSNDGSNFTDILQITVSNTIQNVWTYFNVLNTNHIKYKYYRLNTTQSNVGSGNNYFTQIEELNIYGRS